MTVEFKLEGAVVKGEIKRSPLFLNEHPGPGLILSLGSNEQVKESYRKAFALKDDWTADEFAVRDTLDAYRDRKGYEAIVSEIERSSRGQPELARMMLRDYRMIGEPYAVLVELVQDVNGRVEWRIVGQSDRDKPAPRQLLSTGAWVPTEDIYEELEDLARGYAYGYIEPVEGGQFKVTTNDQQTRVLADKLTARYWLFSRARPWLEDYDGQRQASAMNLAAWDKAQEGLDRINAVINCETFDVTASLQGPGGVRRTITRKGVIGEAEAESAVLALVEEIHPTGFPTPRMH